MSRLASFRCFKCELHVLVMQAGTWPSSCVSSFLFFSRHSLRVSHPIDKRQSAAKCQLLVGKQSQIRVVQNRGRLFD